MFVNGDAALIDSVCRKSGADSFCHLCFSTFTRSIGEDARGLGRTSIDCTQYKSIQIRDVLGPLAVSAPNQQIKKLLVDGEFAYHNAEGELDAARSSWQDGHYADASNHVLAALKFGQDYEDLLGSQVPNETLSNLIDTFEGFAIASAGVLKEL